MYNEPCTNQALYIVFEQMASIGNTNDESHLLANRPINMLSLLVSVAIINAAWSQTTCPSLRAIQSTQHELANATAQLRSIVASYDQQQSSESLTNLMQLLLARQLMAELDHNKPATEDSDSSPATKDSCDCNEIFNYN